MDTNETVEPTEDQNDAQPAAEAAADAPKEGVEQAATAEAPEAAPEATAEAEVDQAAEPIASAKEEEAVEAEDEELSNIPAFAAGDTVKVNVKVVEGTRERIQAFEGVVMRIRNNATGGNFTVRRVSHGVGVERTFLFNSPRVDSVEVKRNGKVRRAKLYYLRNYKWKLPRIKEKRY